MEKDRETSFLFLLLLLLQVCSVRSKNSSSFPVTDLACDNDFSQTLTCVWNSTSAYQDTVCKIHALVLNRSKQEKHYFFYNAFCDMEPDVFKPGIKNCSLTFKKKHGFSVATNISLNVTCNPMKQWKTFTYKPDLHIKLNPPGKPHVNGTTVSWLPQVLEHKRINSFKSHLQWKQQDKSWDDASVQENYINCETCEAQLIPQLLMQGQAYEARVRVLSAKYSGTWSDWSKTESWVSGVGTIKPPSGNVNFWIVNMAGFVVIGLIVAVFYIITVKTTWIYITKMITGSPLPNPAKSSNLQTWLSPYFTSESFNFFSKPVEINSIDIASTMHAVKPSKLDLKVIKDKSNQESTNSSFSSPSYSEFCGSSPISLLPAGNLEPCTADSPYGPVSGQGEKKNVELDEVAEKKMELLKLLCNGNGNIGATEVISDYEKVEKLQHEHLMLQNADSGICTIFTCKEVTREPVATDRIKKTDADDEGTLCKEEKEEDNSKKRDFQRFFGTSGGIFGKESIQVCSDYEQVPKLPAKSPELPSTDSGISSGGEEHESQEESMEVDEKSTHFLFPPPSFLPFASLSQQPLSFSGSGLSPVLQHLPCLGLLEMAALRSDSRYVEPSGEGYMPVRQEES